MGKMWNCYWQAPYKNNENKLVVNVRTVRLRRCECAHRAKFARDEFLLRYALLWFSARSVRLLSLFLHCRFSRWNAICASVEKPVRAAAYSFCFYYIFLISGDGIRIKHSQTHTHKIVSIRRFKKQAHTLHKTNKHTHARTTRTTN